MTEKALSKMFTKLKKLGIIEKVKKDTYKINKDIIKYGTSDFEEGEYVKVNITNTVKVLKETSVSLSSTEIEMLLDLLTTITFRNDENDFNGNIVTFNKDTRKEFEEKYDVCSRSLDNFIKKLKDLKIVNKMANGLYQINETLIVFGGEFRTVQRPDQKTIEERLKEKQKESAAFRESIEGRAIGKFFPKM
jgi:CRISPR/Cas system-associated endonuclease Cas1